MKTHVVTPFFGSLFIVVMFQSIFFESICKDNLLDVFFVKVGSTFFFFILINDR